MGNETGGFECFGGGGDGDFVGRSALWNRVR